MVKDEIPFNKSFEILRYNQSPISKFPFGVNFTKGLLNIENTFGNQIYLSLRNNVAYIGVHKNKDFFEPNFLKEITIETCFKIYNELINCLMVVDIIDELNHGTPNPNLKHINNE